MNSLHKVKQCPVINKRLSRSGSECILAWRSWRIHASILSARGCLAPPMNAESDIMREKMHDKQTGTRLGTRPPACYDVTGIHRHIPPGHANECSQALPMCMRVWGEPLLVLAHHVGSPTGSEVTTAAILLEESFEETLRSWKLLNTSKHLKCLQKKKGKQQRKT